MKKKMVDDDEIHLSQIITGRPNGNDDNCCRLSCFSENSIIYNVHLIVIKL